MAETAPDFSPASLEILGDGFAQYEGPNGPVLVEVNDFGEPVDQFPTGETLFT